MEMYKAQLDVLGAQSEVKVIPDRHVSLVAGILSPSLVVKSPRFQT